MKEFTIEYNGNVVTVKPEMTVSQRFDFADELYDLIVDKDVGAYFHMAVEPGIRALFLQHCTDINFEGRNMLDVMDECMTSPLFSDLILGNDVVKAFYDELKASSIAYVNDKYFSDKNSATENVVNGILSGIKEIVDKLNGFDVDAAINVINKFNNMDEKEIIEEVVDKA